MCDPDRRRAHRVKARSILVSDSEEWTLSWTTFSHSGPVVGLTRVQELVRARLVVRMRCQLSKGLPGRYKSANVAEMSASFAGFRGHPHHTSAIYHPVPVHNACLLPWIVSITVNMVVV